MMRMLFRWRRPDAARVRHAVQLGIAALLSFQGPDGSFPVLQREPNTPWRRCHPLFSTLSVILAAAACLPEEAVSRAVDFVLRCRRPDKLWEFDPSFDIPPDVDVTACAVAVLMRHRSRSATADDAAILRTFWRSDGGPFQTWRGDGKWSARDRDDAVVNCNVLLALRELGARPSVEEVDAVLRLVRASEGGCRYYCSPMTIAYAACRAGLPIDSLPPRLTARPDPTSGILPMAQWLSFARRWDGDAAAHVLAAQVRDGSWPTEAWFTAVGKPRPVWGGPAISTALCVEALQHALAAQAN